MRFTENTYGNRKTILKFPDHYINLAVTVDDTGITADANGKKIVPGGTIIGNGILMDLTKKAKKAITTTGVSNAEGVLFQDVDVTYGPAPGALMIHGFVDVTKIPIAPTTEEIAALKQITFLK